MEEASVEGGSLRPSVEAELEPLLMEMETLLRAKESAVILALQEPQPPAGLDEFDLSILYTAFPVCRAAALGLAKPQDGSYALDRLARSPQDLLSQLKYPAVTIHTTLLKLLDWLDTL